MIDGATREVWAHRILFVVLALVFLFFRLLPLGEVIAPCGPEATGCRLMAWFSHMPGPDLLLCIIFAWTMRRPDYLPVLLIAAVVLLEDLIMLRPPGLWTGLVVLVSEIIRKRIGFDGLLLTDDLDMQALGGAVPDRAARAQAAGCDIALNCWAKMDDMRAMAERLPPLGEAGLARLERALAGTAVGDEDGRKAELLARRDDLLALVGAAA